MSETETAGAQLKKGAVSEAGRALGSIKTEKKAEAARSNGLVMKGQKLTEEQKERQRAGRAAYDARRKQEAAERAEKRQADAEAERERKRAERAAQLAAVEPKVKKDGRGRPPKKPVEQVAEGQVEQLLTA